MREPDNIKALVKLKPDFIGLIFYPKSKRYVSDSLAAEISPLIPKDIQKVGVFVNATAEEIEKKTERFGLNMLQLHGNEQPEFCESLKHLGLPIIKAFGIDEGFNFKKTKDYSVACDYFLFDTKSVQYGGTGKKYNWEILGNYTGKTPIILSGGIGPEDSGILEKLKELPLAFIDINSRFEIDPALKDIKLLQNFFSKLKH